MRFSLRLLTVTVLAGAAAANKSPTYKNTIGRFTPASMSGKME